MQLQGVNQFNTTTSILVGGRLARRLRGKEAVFEVTHLILSLRYYHIPIPLNSKNIEVRILSFTAIPLATSFVEQLTLT
ncbi:hypothetical protein HOLleu_39583 [Holothuria leucospilota]|uniref:Uncharacterized protein n=1 Tax=Holothuria leucospilota TaxID=206669 RepID=A0A9Q0YNI5_HOLLE|nr:hypothetical protein HOLleu_39583 [Holothuria leucospilota]